MSIDAHQAAALIASHINRKLQAKSGTALNVQTDFCKIWPEVKPALGFVEEVLGFMPVPGIGITLSGLLSGLSALADQIDKQVCPGKNP